MTEQEMLAVLRLCSYFLCFTVFGLLTALEIKRVGKPRGYQAVKPKPKTYKLRDLELLEEMHVAKGGLSVADEEGRVSLENNARPCGV